MFVKKESTSVYRKARSNLNLTDEILQVLNLFWKTIIFFSKSWTEIIREQEARSKNNKTKCSPPLVSSLYLLQRSVAFSATSDC